MSVSLNPDIFKAYDVRGVYPSEINEDTARAIGTAFSAYLGAKRIAVGRDMRLSSPALAAAFIAGATSQGTDVVDYGMISTDMLYFAVARDGHEGGVQITASHNPKQYNGMKMVRKEAFPLSGEEGLKEIREMIAGGTLPPATGAPGQVTTQNVLDPYIEHLLEPVADSKNVVANCRVFLPGPTEKASSPWLSLLLVSGSSSQIDRSRSQRSGDDGRSAGPMR